MPAAKQRGTAKQFRLSDEGVELLEKLAKREGVTQVAVVELALREMAEKKGVRFSGVTAEGATA